MKKGRIIGALTAVVAIAAVGVYIAIGARAAVPEVSVADALEGELVRAVTVSGRTAMGEKVDVYPPTAGTLAEVFVRDGDEVKAGDPLAVLDKAPLEAQLAAAEAGYQGARAQLDALDAQQPTSADAAAASAGVNAAWEGYIAARESVAMLEGVVADIRALGLGGVDLSSIETTNPAAVAVLEALEELEADGIIKGIEGVTLALLEGQVTSAEAQANQAYAAYLQAVGQREALDSASGSGSAQSAAQAGVDQAYHALLLARDALSEATMTAPIDGVVVFNTGGASIAGVNVPAAEPGPGFSVSPAAAPFTVMRLGALEFIGDVDEANVSGLEIGAPATVVLDAFPGVEFATSVERVGVIAQTTATGGNIFPAYLGMSDTGHSILVGMRGSADIELERIADTVSVPIEALFDEEGGTVVYVVEDGLARRVEVETGVYTTIRVEIVSGLEGGETLVLTSSVEMTDGMEVRVRDEDRGL